MWYSSKTTCSRTQPSHITYSTHTHIYTPPTGPLASRCSVCLKQVPPDDTRKAAAFRSAQEAALYYVTICPHKGKKSGGKRNMVIDMYPCSSRSGLMLEWCQKACSIDRRHPTRPLGPVTICRVWFVLCPPGRGGEGGRRALMVLTNSSISWV